MMEQKGFQGNTLGMISLLQEIRSGFFFITVSLLIQIPSIFDKSKHETKRITSLLSIKISFGKKKKKKGIEISLFGSVNNLRRL